VRFVVLTSKPNSPYADTATSYEYPSRYRRFFEPLDHGELMVAVIYEPRANGLGRMAYVGWAALREPPQRSPRVTAGGQPLWEVRYVDRVQEFPIPVPRDPMGVPIERWIRETAAANRSIVTSGASVRWLADDEAQRILELGHAGSLGVETYPDDTTAEASVVAERSRRVVEAVERDARFRRGVMRAYEFRCSVTGLEIGTLAAGRATRLLDAAHIRPVGDRGPDTISNGLSLTPTVHRLFDEGLISVRWSSGALELVRSPHLEVGVVESQERGTRIKLDTGMPLLLPMDRSLWPSVDQVRYHHKHVFRGADAVTA
jgi:putative restriction endonuclease